MARASMCPGMDVYWYERDTIMVIIVLLGMTIVLQLMAGALALRLIRITEKRTGWVLLALAIALLTLQRCFYFLRVSAGEAPLPPLISAVLGLSIALCLVAGVASIATRVGGNSELIEDGVSGLLIAPGATESLAGYLQTLATHPCWRRELGRKARKRVEDCYSLQRMLTNYGNLYREALGNRKRRVAALHTSRVQGCDHAAAGGR